MKINSGLLRSSMSASTSMRERVLKFYTSGDKQTHSFEVPASEDKLERTRVHKAIKGNLRNFETKQIVDEKTQKKMIRAEYQGRKNKKLRRYDGKTNILSFVLHKKFTESQDAIYTIAKKLNRNPKDFYIAGNKVKKHKK